MRKSVLSLLGGVLVLAAAAQAVMLLDGTSRLVANAEPSELLAGCMDVPEAVTLADTLKDRALRVDRYLQELERKRPKSPLRKNSLAKS